MTDTEKAIAWFENQNKYYDDKEAYQEDYRMNVIALAALRAEQERRAGKDTNVPAKPLTLDELKQTSYEPVYIVQTITGRELGGWRFRRDGGFDNFHGEWIADEDSNFEKYGTLWFAYRHKPQEYI